MLVRTSDRTGDAPHLRVCAVNGALRRMQRERRVAGRGMARRVLASVDGMEFRVLGPLEVRGEHGPVALGGSKLRGTLAFLLLHSNEPVSAERLAVALWGEEAPARAIKTVQVHVSRLRQALGDSRVLVTTAAGYRLCVQPDELDSQRFERLVEAGRRALAQGDAEGAGTVLREALALWRARRWRISPSSRLP